jgi:DNA invertase Pin-like site-specific DNA recombinase
MEENNNGIQPPTKITIAKYKRCSTDNQELTLQDEVLDKHIQRLKEDNPSIEYGVLDFKDFALSGKNTERPEFKRMMELVEKKKINIIIFTKLDRLARSLQDLLNISSVLEKNNVKFTAVEQNIDTSTYQGRLNFQIMGAFAEFERNITRERMELGRKRAEIAGSKSGKPCHRPKVEIDEDGVKFKHRGGWSMHQIAKHYNVSITPIRRILKE